ncbi:uncharacterized protein LOC123509228 [Portunus trituberculatus]|uniref:uncharacterized protein LOC123509228 n=1 Tax=Portunus trituberculatus TaxID=210409 RepID=UPI001E1CD7DB|nr:uncharacterized protein LOC123509228 [Portunus trituberculatus]
MSGIRKLFPVLKFIGNSAVVFFFFFFWGRVDENEARSVAQDGSESSSTSDTTPATSFSLHATTDPSSLRSPVAVCVLALGVTCSNGGNSNGKLDAQHSTAQHSGEIGGELTIQRPDSTAVMSLVYLALSSLTTPTTNPSASATVSRSGRTLPCIAHCDGRRPAPPRRRCCCCCCCAKGE